MNGEDLARAQKMGFKEGENLFYVHGVGVDLNRFNQESEVALSLRRQLGLRDEDVAVSCGAEFIPRKNHTFLLAAWQKVAEEEPRASLFLVGDGRLRKAMERKVSKEWIPRMHLLGFRRDVPDLLQATDVRGSRDLVDHGKTGFLVNLGDVRRFAEVLLHLIRNPKLRQKMGETGQVNIRDYAIDNVLREMETIYALYLGRHSWADGRVTTSEYRKLWSGKI